MLHIDIPLSVTAIGGHAFTGGEVNSLVGREGWTRTRGTRSDAPPGDVLQVSVGIDVLLCAAASPQPPPLVVWGGIFNEAAVAVTDDYFLYRMGVTVPRIVTHVHIHSLVEFIQG